MKRTLSRILSLLLILSVLSSALAFAEDSDAAETPDQETTVEDTATEEAAPVETPAEEADGPEDTDTAKADAPKKLSPAEIIAMSNAMNRGGVSRSGKWTVRWAYDNGNLRMRSINTATGESRIIGSNAQPWDMIADGIYVTYISSKSSSDNGEIRRVRVSGGDDHTLIDCTKLGFLGQFHHLIEYDDHYYFAVNNNKTSPITGTFFRSDKDGENIVPILEKAVYYPYIIDDKIYYQDDNDGSRLHVCNLDGSGDQVFIDDFTFEFFTDGVSFYYDSVEPKPEFDEKNKITNEADLKRVLKIYTPGEGTVVVPEVSPRTMAFDGSTIYYAATDDEERLYTYNLATGKIDVLSFNDYIVYTVFYNSSTLLCIDTTKSALENVIFMNTDGTGLSDAM